MTDLRDIAADGDALWIAALSGLIRYRPAENRWQVWTTADGLIDNTCESTVLWRDSVWIGTQGGISRYDPATDAWQSYTTEHGLTGLHNVRLYVDTYADVLWAGTFEGLATYDPLTDRWIEQTDDYVALVNVTQIAADADFVWVNGGENTNRGIWQFDRATNTWHEIHAVDNTPPPDLYAFASQESLFWVLGARGILYEYDRLAGTWRTLVKLGNSEIVFPPTLAYRAPEIWIGTRRGWTRYNVETEQSAFVSYPREHAPVSQGPPTFAQNTAWVPTQAGLYALDLSGQTWSRHAPIGMPEQISRILLTDQDKLFLDTGRQIGTLDPRRGEWHPVRHLPDQPTWGLPTIAREAGVPDLWLYSPPVGILSTSSAPKIWHYAHRDAIPEPIPVPDEFALTRLLPLVDQGQLWFQASNALVTHDPREHRWHSYPYKSAAGYLAGIAQEEGAIWLIMGGKTLIRFDTQQQQGQVWPIPFGIDWSLIALSPDTVWLGGESSALLAFDRVTSGWEEHPLDTACVGYRVVTLHADPTTIWVGGERSVAHYDRKTRQQTCYTKENGMLDNQVTQIVTNSGQVWFVHPWRGLWSYGPLPRKQQ